LGTEFRFRTYLYGVRLLLALILAATPALAASDYLALKARFYDHDYDDFGGEFSATRVAGCSNEVHGETRGMVQDTLVWDSTQGRKYPRRGSVDECSSQLENWFNPASSRSTTCGTLFFSNVGDSARPDWKFDAPAFFPLDSISPQRSVVLPNGTIVADDYAYCMEINAAIDYAGGDTLKVRGDDDTWVFLDDRLAVDQGGIHYAKQVTLALDTLPFLKGKLGRTLDLDVYYCSRQPATAVFGMEVAARLRPLPLKSLQITDSAGHPLSSQDVLIGKSRVCARANYQSPGEEQCGNYQPPPDLAFLSADWDLNGKRLSMDGGQACLDLDPATFPDRTRLSLTARSSGLISRVAVTLVRPARPAEGWLGGCGRADKVEIRLDTTGGAAPDGLDIAFDFGGAHRTAQVRPDPLRPWTLAGNLEGTNAGPPGLTGFAPVIAVTQESIFGRAIGGSVPLRDGVSPALADAALSWGGNAGLPARLDLRASEPLAGTADSLAFGLAWKRPTGDWGGPRWASASADSAGRISLPLTEDEARSLKAGDSVSLGPRIRDLAGNAAGYSFLPIFFPRNLDVTKAELRVRPDPARSRAFVPHGGGVLIPVDSAGHPLDPNGADAEAASAGGPVLEIPLIVPPSRIRLVFHDHLGNFVNALERTFSDADWDAMRRAAPGDTTKVRLLWYPIAHTGNRLGTGAYIVQGRLWTRAGPARGPDGNIVEMEPASLAIPPRLFGYLRE
jgi:fibro-slime domain-containing protein